MQTASFNGLLKTILYIFAFYYVIKFLARVFLPVLVKKAVEKAGENFQQQQNARQSQYNSNTASGDRIIYDTSKTDKPRETNKVGEYVDYEEID